MHFSLALSPNFAKMRVKEFYYRHKFPGTKERDNSNEILEAGKQMGKQQLP
jgi:hypothetical protein